MSRRLIRSNTTLKLAQYGMLIALEIVLAFTIGIITVPPVSITLLHIPVIIGAIVLGPTCGSIMGAVFGFCTIIRATMTGNPGDMLFNPAASGSPLGSLIMSIVPRVLLGLIAGYLFILAKKLVKKELIAIPITAILATALHTVMVLFLMWLFFPSALGGNVVLVFSTVVSLNGIIEIAAATALSMAIAKPLLAYNRKQAAR